MRLVESKKLGSHPFQDSEWEFTFSSLPVAFLSRQLTVGSPFSEDDTLYLRFLPIASLSIWDTNVGGREQKVEETMPL